MAASTLVLILVFIFDLIAFALAIAAEQRRSTAKVVLDKEAYYKYCVYDSDISTGLGVGALLFLVLTQSLLMLVTKCFCCGRALRPGGARVWAILLFITSWVTFIIAAACLVAGSVRNAYHTRFVMFQDPLSCETLRKGVFGAGAAFIFFTAILSELYYLSCAKAANDQYPIPTYGRRESAVGMGSY